MLPALQLVPTAYLTGSAATVYTSPFAAGTNGIVLITGFILANTDTAARTVTLHNIPSGGSAGGGNKILPAVSIPANTSWFENNPDGLLVLPAAGFLQAFADTTNKVTFTLFGREIS